jgi:hypothetical protein
MEKQMSLSEWLKHACLSFLGDGNIQRKPGPGTSTAAGANLTGGGGNGRSETGRPTDTVPGNTTASPTDGRTQYQVILQLVLQGVGEVVGQRLADQQTQYQVILQLVLQTDGHSTR